MRRCVAILLAIVLGLGASAPVFAQESGQAAPAPNVAMAPELSCIPANKNPQASVALTPFNDKATCRLYFKSALGADWYYINLIPGASAFEGTLPAPVPGAGPISYYAECLAATTPGQTAQIEAVVVESESQCGNKPVAAIGPSTAVTVYSMAGSAAAPAGFAGVGSVIAGSAIGAGAAGVAGAAAAGGISTTAIVVTAAAVVAVGATTAVVVSGGEDTPASPSR